MKSNNNRLVVMIFTELKNMKLDYTNRTGKETIDFSVGSPNIAPEPSIMKALQDAIMVPENYKYAINELPEMKAAIHDWYKNRYNVELTNDEMICLQGSQEALSTLFLAICDPGDIVLVPDPALQSGRKHCYTGTLRRNRGICEKI